MIKLVRYRLLAADGPIGHVRDFLVDIEARTVCSVVVGTRNWLPGGKVMMPPWHVTKVFWSRKSVFLFVPRRTIRECPKYCASAGHTVQEDAGLRR